MTRLWHTYINFSLNLFLRFSINEFSLLKSSSNTKSSTPILSLRTNALSIAILNTLAEMRQWPPKLTCKKDCDVASYLVLLGGHSHHWSHLPREWGMWCLRRSICTRRRCANMSSGFSRRGRGPYERSGGQGREGGRHPSGLSGKDIGMYYRDRSQAKKKDKEKNEVGFGTSGFNIDNRVNERDRKRKSRLKNASCRISRSLVSYENNC